MANFIYLVADPVTREAVVVDAAWDTTGILRVCEGEGLRLVGAAVTHSHFDHVGGKVPGSKKTVRGIRDFAKSGKRALVPRGELALTAKMCKAPPTRGHN